MGVWVWASECEGGEKGPQDRGEEKGQELKEGEDGGLRQG